MENVVAYIYHGEVNILEEELRNFILVANELQLKGLMALYEKQPSQVPQLTTQEGRGT